MNRILWFLLEALLAFLGSIALGTVFMMTAALGESFLGFPKVSTKGGVVYLAVAASALGNPLGLLLTRIRKRNKAAPLWITLPGVLLASTGSAMAFLQLGTWLVFSGGFASRLGLSEFTLTLACMACVSAISCATWHLIDWTTT